MAGAAAAAAAAPSAQVTDEKRLRRENRHKLRGMINKTRLEAEELQKPESDRLEKAVDEADEVDEVDEVEVEDEGEGGTPDDVFLTAAVASVAPPSVAASSTPSEEAETSTSPTSTSPTTATVASAGARPGSAASRSNFVSKLPAPPPLSARNPKDGPQKPKGGT